MEQECWFDGRATAAAGPAHPGRLGLSTSCYHLAVSFAIPHAPACPYKYDSHSVILRQKLKRLVRDDVSCTMSLVIVRALRNARFNAAVTQCIRQFSATMQPMTADERPNILADIKRDHAQFFSLHRRFQEELGLSDHDKQVIIWQLIHDLVVHSLAEEEVLYPEFKNMMGSRCRDHALSEHKTLKDFLVDLDGMTIDSPGFKDKLEGMMHVLQHHIREEEDEMLVEFAEKVDREKLEELSKKFNQSKHSVPTRPHTVAPDKPITGNIVMNRLTAPIDKLRDMARFAGEAGAPAGPQ